MKSTAFKFVLAISAVVVTLTAASADSLPAPSSWKNQRGSQLNVWSVTNGQIQGEFINNAAGFECQGIPYPATGQVSPNSIYFVVTFVKCNSFTIWRGRVNGPQMPTRWKLFYVKPGGTPASLSGSDTFSRTN